MYGYLSHDAFYLLGWTDKDASKMYQGCTLTKSATLGIDGRKTGGKCSYFLTHLLIISRGRYIYFFIYNCLPYMSSFICLTEHMKKSWLISPETG